MALPVPFLTGVTAFSVRHGHGAGWAVGVRLISPALRDANSSSEEGDRAASPTGSRRGWGRGGAEGAQVRTARGLT